MRVEFLCETHQTLLEVLRDELHLTGTKEGCATGDCGACSVTVDGRLMCSCLMLGAEAQGKSIQTIEGMANGDKLHPLQQKFLEHAALQCGICTPGVLVAAQGAARAQSRSDRGRSALLAGGQPVPLHRVQQDHRGGARRRQRNAEEPDMASVIVYPERELKVVGTQPGAPRRRAEGDGPRPIRRGLHPARHAVGQDPALAARACAHPLDRHIESGGAAGRQGGDDGGGPSRPEVRLRRPRARRREFLAHDAQHHGAREGALRGSCHRRRRRDHARRSPRRR